MPQDIINPYTFLTALLRVLFYDIILAMIAGHRMTYVFALCPGLKVHGQ